MKPEEALACAKSLRQSPAFHRRVEQAIRTLAASVNDELSTFNIFEFGLRSDGPDHLQINHIQGYPETDKKTEQRLVQIKIQAISDFARSVNRMQKSSFSENLVDELMPVFKDNHSAYSRVLFSFEMELPSGNLTKMTLYGLVDSKRDARKIGAALNFKDLLALERFISPNLCNIGIDLLPQGSAKLKVYRWWPLIPDDIKDKNLRSSLQALHSIFPVRDFGTMLKIRPDGRAESPVKWGITFRHPTTVGDISQLPPLRERFPDFLNYTSRYLPNHTISYLGFDKDAMGIYCGKGIEDWLPWLRRSDD